MGKSNTAVTRKTTKATAAAVAQQAKAAASRVTPQNSISKPRKGKVYILDDCISGINEPSLDRVSRRAGVTQANKSTSGFRRVKDKKTGQYVKLAIEKEQSLTELRRADIKESVLTLHKDCALFAKAQGRVTITDEDVKRAVNNNWKQFRFQFVA
jgi:histone H3/H4